VKSGARGREFGNESLSRDCQEILREVMAMPRRARLAGASGMRHRTTVRDADLIEGIGDWK
jgi:hypothetical protein